MYVFMYRDERTCMCLCTGMSVHVYVYVQGRRARVPWYMKWSGDMNQKTKIYIGGIFPNTGTKYVAPELAPGTGSLIKHSIGAGSFIKHGTFRFLYLPLCGMQSFKRF